MKKKAVLIGGVLVAAVGGLLTACGGGGGGSDNSGTPNPSGTLLHFHGEVIGGSVGSASRVLPKHAAGEPFTGVTICALSSCAVTDAEGSYSFTGAETFTSGSVTFTLKGPEFDTSSGVRVTAGARDVDVDFVSNNGIVQVAQVKIDGVVDTTQTSGSFNDGD